MKTSGPITLILLWLSDFADSQNPLLSLDSIAKDSSDPPNGVGETCWGHMVALQEKANHFYISPNASDVWALKSEHRIHYSYSKILYSLCSINSV